jgi:phage baseplate assembly protein V
MRGRVDAMVARAVLSRVNDALKTQRLQLTILDDETVDDVEHFQPYGLSFVPPAGAECIALAISGARSHTVAICAQHPEERPKSKPPRTGGLYTSGQWRVFIDADGVVHLGAEAGAEFVALAAKVLTELNDIRSKFDTHTHLVNVTGSSSAQSGTAAAPASAMGPAGSVAATKAKAT